MGRSGRALTVRDAALVAVLEGCAWRLAYCGWCGVWDAALDAIDYRLGLVGMGRN